VDVTTRLGVLTPATTTGIKALDRMLAGGLRNGTVLGVTGDAGAGRTAFALLVGYMAARTKAAVLFTSVALDQTEVMARLAARALYREFPETRVQYGAIWSGQAFREDRTRRQVAAAVETVVDKVGSVFHLHSALPFESTSSLAERTAHLWNRHERVVLVVDGIEAFSASPSGDPARVVAANSGLENRLALVAYELRTLSEKGCAVVFTGRSESASVVAQACTVSAELKAESQADPAAAERLQAFGARRAELVVNKNRIGPTGSVPLTFVAGASVYEEKSG
jgi:replicative DNA helicase